MSSSGTGNFKAVRLVLPKKLDVGLEFAPLFDVLLIALMFTLLGSGFITAPGFGVDLSAPETSEEALKLPENGNGRLFGQHTERNLLPWWTAAYNAVEGGMNFALSGHTGQWVNSYRALKTYIQIMRFLGHNMVMQGAYMYFWGIPLERYCEASLNDRMDIYKLFAGMYRRNHIAMYMVMEFLHPQFLFLEGKAERILCGV